MVAAAGEVVWVSEIKQLRAATGERIMKLIITAQGTDLTSTVDPRFGRAAYFVIYDTDSKQASAIDNAQNLNAVQGAGIQAACNVIEAGAECVITGNVGPKAFTTLQAGKISIYVGAEGTVQEAIEQFNSGKLKTADQANVEGHWS